MLKSTHGLEVDQWQVKSLHPLFDLAFRAQHSSCVALPSWPSSRLITSARTRPGPQRYSALAWRCWATRWTWPVASSMCKLIAARRRWKTIVHWGFEPFGLRFIELLERTWVSCLVVIATKTWMVYSICCVHTLNHIGSCGPLWHLSNALNSFLMIHPTDHMNPCSPWLFWRSSRTGHDKLWISK